MVGFKGLPAYTVNKHGAIGLTGIDPLTVPNRTSATMPFLLAGSRVAGIASWPGAAGGPPYPLLGHLHARCL
jgi:hypothetical protein